MGEVLNVIVAFAVIVFAVRWATKGPSHALGYHLLVMILVSGKEQPNNPGAVLGFRPKHATDEMVCIFRRRITLPGH
jgi:coupling of ubiquitin conjugation to ER degradation protein 1